MKKSITGIKIGCFKIEIVKALKGQIIGCNSMNDRCPSNCYFDYWNMFFIDKFCLIFTNKVLIEVFQKFATFFLPCFTFIFSLQKSETTFLWYFLFLNVWTITKTTYNLLFSEGTLLCCINVHLFPTTQHIITMKQKIRKI